MKLCHQFQYTLWSLYTYTRYTHIHTHISPTSGMDKAIMWSDTRSFAKKCKQLLQFFVVLYRCRKLGGAGADHANVDASEAASDELDALDSATNNIWI